MGEVLLLFLGLKVVKLPIENNGYNLKVREFLLVFNIFHCSKTFSCQIKFEFKFIERIAA